MELQVVLRKLKADKARGPDGLPPEYFKAILHNRDAMRELLDFCNLCWESKQVPQDWHMAKVTEIFKKGDPALCSNYRPISLLSLGYKIFASLILRRLKDGGTDSLIWPNPIWIQVGRRDGRRALHGEATLGEDLGHEE